MRYHELTEYSTKDGRDIKFTFNEDTEQENRGWVVHELNASVNGQDAGYLKISYVPKENLKQFYPTVFNYMSQIGGLSGLLPHDDRQAHYKDISSDNRRSLVARLKWERGLSDFDLEEFSGRASDDEILAVIKDIEARIKRGKSKWHDQFLGFKRFHVDKPLVDFIRVNKGPNLDWPSQSEGNENFRRQHIGLALYQEGAKEMAKKGMRLWASGLQQSNASSAWDKMQEFGWVKKSGKRRYINVAALPKV